MQTVGKFRGNTSIKNKLRNFDYGVVLNLLI